MSENEFTPKDPESVAPEQAENKDVPKEEPRDAETQNTQKNPEPFEDWKLWNERCFPQSQDAPPPCRNAIFTPSLIDEPPLRIREYLTLFTALVVSDLCIYKGGGHAGFAVIFIILPFLILSGAAIRKISTASWILLGLSILVGIRSIYLGSVFIAIVGIVLIYLLAYSLTGRSVLHERIIGGFLLMVILGIRSLYRYSRNVLDKKRGRKISHVIVPLVFVGIFATIFVLANPVLKDSIKNAYDNLDYFIPGFGRIFFWAAMLILAAGLLRPPYDIILNNEETIETKNPETEGTYESPHYPITRNTMLGLILLFAAYFVFEFYYLWLRAIPEDFRYSEYAHKGAAWLTFALALATVILGLVFTGKLMRDHRNARLKKIVWIWYGENFILALCAWHRTQIYVHYNGLSSMRVVAVFGIAAVTAGFMLVIVKVAKGKSFRWLVRRQLAALFIAVVIYLITPADFIVTRYNVSRIMSGDYAPTVQIAAHKIGPGGVPSLIPLLKCENEIVSNGARELLIRKYKELVPKGAKLEVKGWTYYQIAENRALEAINKNINFKRKRTDRDKAWSEFHEFGMRYYD